MKKLGVTVLVSSQTAVKGGQGFDIAVGIENLRGGDWDETQNGVHRVRSMHSRSSSFSVVSKTKHSKTKNEARSTQISKTKHPELENEAPKSRKRSTQKLENEDP